MENIAIRYIAASQTAADFSEGFSIRDLRDLLAGKDMVQKLHRHDFFYILALKLEFERETFDAIGLVYAHFLAGQKSIFHKKLNDYLRPGGIIILEAFGKGH